MNSVKVRIGTRGSLLARRQADWVQSALESYGITAEIVEISTSGDKTQAGPIADIGLQGVFTKEIQRALLENTIDLAVHSLKDLPTEPVAGLMFAAAPLPGPRRDVFLSPKADSLGNLPIEAVIGTGSVRRKAQILHHFPEKRFRVTDIRGNVETRLKKLDSGDYDAIILAEAGLTRLGLTDRITSPLEPPFFLPAVGQGILGIETRTEDTESIRIAGRLNHPETFAAAVAERTLLAALRGGCLAPVAALAEKTAEHRLRLHARVFSPDGGQMLDATRLGDLRAAEELGRSVAEELLLSGAESLLRP
ncbi:MAG: hydroxymethylbilane synthase [Planctomycetaceae bacterium]|jgi:hydroxymethylbilane synthase|nr:hydroxymethylbilane synthase [Planctomycetaceae bacterium]